MGSGSQMNGRNGTNGSVFPVRTSRGFFSIGEPGSWSRSSRSSREKHDFILPFQEVLFVSRVMAKEQMVESPLIPTFRTFGLTDCKFFRKVTPRRTKIRRIELVMLLPQKGHPGKKGSSILKVTPFSFEDSTLIRPPCRSTICLLIARPRPHPFFEED